MIYELDPPSDFSTSLSTIIASFFWCFSICYSLNVCIPQIHMLNSNPQGHDIVKWGLWEVIR